jgi:diacylglycerol kinase (ATP)
MKQNRRVKNQISTIKLIYNPNAGLKRKLVTAGVPVSLEDIKSFLKQYQIPVDYFPTKGPGHATDLARDAKKEGYKTVLVAGGDGTVGEAANGLVNSDITLGILPLGSFMNIARMLSIPTELEKAVALVKIGRVRKIDVGAVTKLSNDKLNTPYYFLESAGIGLEAHIHEHAMEIEKGNKKAAFKILKTFFDYYSQPTIVTVDDRVIKTKSLLIAISNGPYTGTAIPLAPDAKLNDHRLTVSIFKMSKWELFKFFSNLIFRDKRNNRKVQILQGRKVRIESTKERLVHADARLYGATPVEFKIIPNALNVISGFPKESEDTSLIKRTFLDP